jgi:UDP-glucose:(heptosyl)LPS alpha-1,3-glucosyltransferase
MNISDRIRFLGYCDDMRDYYYAADFLVHPTFYDPCSLVVLEALACGLPVITSIHNGASELLKPPVGGLVINDPHDHRELASHIELMAVPEIRKRFAAEARRLAGEWSFEQHYRQVLAVLREAAARRHAH